MPIQPRIDDPSKPSPSLNVSLSHKSTGKEQCCQVPSMSTNLRSTISALFFFARAKNSSAVMARHLFRKRQARARPVVTCEGHWREDRKDSKVSGKCDHLP